MGVSDGSDAVPNEPHAEAMKGKLRRRRRRRRDAVGA